MSSTDFEAYDDDAVAGSRTVGVRTAGADVAFLQRFIGRLKDDGYFGQATLNRVRWYQRTHGLASDGVVGNGTWKSILGVLPVAATPIAPKQPIIVTTNLGGDLAITAAKMSVPVGTQIVAKTKTQGKTEL